MTKIVKQIQGEALEFYADRALHWPKRRTLFVTDLHLGKTGTFRHFGIPIPETAAADLARLSRLIEITHAERLIFLGDLIHHRFGMDTQLLACLAGWRAKHACVEMLLIRGNHDRHVEPIIQECKIPCEKKMQESPLRYQHYPPTEAELAESDGETFLCGHLHPIFRLQDVGRYPLKRAGFWIRPQSIVLPAFSDFVDGAVVQPNPNDGVLIVEADQIFDFSPDYRQLPDNSTPQK